jgi:quercetin dioxygenase-like cupin family protein
MNKKEPEHNNNPLRSFVVTLPGTDTKYFELLNQTRNLKLQSGLVTLGPGESVGSHTTGDHEELIIILSGEGELEAEGLGRIKIASGQIAYNPPKTQHNVINTGNEPLRYIFVVVQAIN